MSSDARALQVIGYLHGNQQMDPKIFTEKEISHMGDVRDLYQKIIIILSISALIVVISGYYLYKSSKKQFYDSLKYASIATLSIAIFFAIASLFFNSTFEVFHKIFFKGDSWLFSPQEILPVIFPEQFFFDSFATIFITILIASMVCLLFSWYETIKKRKRT